MGLSKELNAREARGAEGGCMSRVQQSNLIATTQMKIFFVLLLLVSIVFPAYSFLTMIGDFAHNQYEMRLERLEGTTPETSPSPHLGLTRMELSKLDEPVRFAYDDAVRDGYRLGRGYNKLWNQSLGLDALLFVASIIGLTKLRALKGIKSGS